MAVARVVTFDGVSKDRIAELDRQMQEGERPQDFPATEIIVLHDADAQQAQVVIFFDNDEDFRRGDEVLSAMPAEDTPGQRTSVSKYDVAIRVTP